MTRFELSDAQAQAIVDMRLRALTGLEREKIEAEYEALMAKIKELRAILADENLLLGVIKTEIMEIADKYGDERRTSIGFDMYDISTEDLIPRENVVIAMTKLGYIKRMSVDNFKAQNRGGKGVKCYKIMEKTGNVIGVKNLHMDDEIMMINTEGIVIRMMCSDISVLGRVTSGVKLMNLSENVSVASIAKVRETSADSEDIIKKIEDEMIEDEKNDEEIKNEETTQE